MEIASCVYNCDWIVVFAGVFFSAAAAATVAVVSSCAVSLVLANFEFVHLATRLLLLLLFHFSRYLCDLLCRTARLRCISWLLLRLSFCGCRWWHCVACRIGCICGQCIGGFRRCFPFVRSFQLSMFWWNQSGSFYRRHWEKCTRQRVRIKTAMLLYWLFGNCARALVCRMGRSNVSLITSIDDDFYGFYHCGSFVVRFLI